MASKTAFARWMLVGSLLLVFLQEIRGHGRMMDPVSRSSAWRLGFDIPPNYSDTQLNCGGMGNQHQVNGGKCGECGDDYSLHQPRPNENGGIYGLGKIVRNYTQGQVINANVTLTANHLGYFTFSLCHLMHYWHLETMQCFDQYPLTLVDGSSKVEVPSTQSEFSVDLRLPENVTCAHCVLRWQYRTGNNWGICEDGSFGLGCGPQEIFRNCADVSIAPAEESADEPIAPVEVSV